MSKARQSFLAERRTDVDAERISSSFKEEELIILTILRFSGGGGGEGAVCCFLRRFLEDWNEVPNLE